MFSGQKATDCMCFPKSAWRPTLGLFLYHNISASWVCSASFLENCWNYFKYIFLGATQSLNFLGMKEGNKSVSCVSKDRAVSSTALREALGMVSSRPGWRCSAHATSRSLCQRGEKAASSSIPPVPPRLLTAFIQLFRSLAFDERNVWLGQVSYKDVTWQHTLQNAGRRPRKISFHFFLLCCCSSFSLDWVQRNGLYLTNRVLLHQHRVTAAWSRVIPVLVLPGLTVPCGGTENGILVL